MNFTQNVLERIADLAKLELSAAESESFTQSLQEKLKKMDAINQVETKNIEPSIDVFPLRNVFREDKIAECLTKEKIFANASEVENQCFKVPRII